MIPIASPKAVEELMQIISAEFSQRQIIRNSTKNSNRAVSEDPVIPAIKIPQFDKNYLDFQKKKTYALKDFLNLHDEAFIRNAYQGILSREPDSNGFNHYLVALRSGRLSKTEILGHLRYSSEGKRHAVSVQGLFIAFLFQLMYRVPVIGFCFAWVNFTLRLPFIVRNWNRFEAFTAFQHHQQIQRINQLARATEEGFCTLGTVCDQSVYRDEVKHIGIALNEKVSVSDLTNALAELRASLDREEFFELQEELSSKSDRVEIIELRDNLRAKVDKDEISELREGISSKADIKRLIKLEADLFVLGETTEDVFRRIQHKADVGVLNTLTQLLETKTDRAEVEAAYQRLKVLIEDKTDRAEVEAAYQRLEVLIEDKTDRAEVERIRNQLNTKADSSLIELWNTRLENRANNDQLTNLIDQVSLADQRTTDALSRLQQQITDHKRNIVDQQRRLGMLLEEVRKRLEEPLGQEQMEQLAAEQEHILDAFYVSFEDCFRGTREDIKQRLRVYLPLLTKIRENKLNAPVLDIGCGRGEWLEIMKEQGINAIGLDLNRVMVKECRELGFDVVESDAISYLRQQGSNSLWAVTGIHIIEHIPFKRLIVLFDEVLRTLQPGGVAIFETPNPENLITGACNFYYDPTHIHPLPPEPMRFAMEMRGFSRVEVIRLHPYPEEAMLHEGPRRIRQIINDRLFGPQDYALVAYKI